MTLWSPLVEAYEADLQVLEEARVAYLDASKSILGRLAAGIRNLPLAEEAIVTIEVDSPEDEAMIAGAPWLRARFKKAEKLPGFEIDAWVASSWGGPNGVLRIGLALDGTPHPFSAATKHWLQVAQHSLPEVFGGGEPYSPDKHFDAGDAEWLRIHTVPLPSPGEQEILAKGIEISSKLLNGGMQALEGIASQARPLLAAYEALLEQQIKLQAAGQSLEAGVILAKNGRLPVWRGLDYMQIGQFWVCIDPAERKVFAQGQPADSECLEALALAIGREVEQHKGVSSVLLMGEEELHGGSASEVISAAFDSWIAWKLKQPPLSPEIADG